VKARVLIFPLEVGTAVDVEVADRGFSSRWSKRWVTVGVLSTGSSLVCHERGHRVRGALKIEETRGWLSVTLLNRGNGTRRLPCESVRAANDVTMGKARRRICTIFGMQ
jgi:hypothetical protein